MTAAQEPASDPTAETDGDPAARGNDPATHDGVPATHDGGPTAYDGGPTAQDGGPTAQDGGPTAEDGGPKIAAQATGVQGMVERQIRQAQERGAFDDLPGAGEPLRDLGAPHDENWWLRRYLLREGVSGAAFLPPALALRKEIEDLPGRVAELPTEAHVRLAVDRLNERILDALRKPGEGPPVSVMAVDVEEIVLGWRFSRIARRSPPPGSSAAEPARDSERDRPRRPRRWRRGS